MEYGPEERRACAVGGHPAHRTSACLHAVSLPYTLSLAECEERPALFSAVHVYSPPSSTITWLMFT
jgi:hypothetical protein